MSTTEDRPAETSVAMQFLDYDSERASITSARIDFHREIAALARQVHGETRPHYEPVVKQFAALASAHMGGVFEAGALLSLGRTGWRVVSAPGTTAHLIEQIHTDLNAGPAMGAANAQRTMRVSDLAVETRWPRFTSAAVAQRKYGIELRKSAYSMPDGVGEHDLLYLSEQLISAADAADKP